MTPQDKKEDLQADLALAAEISAEINRGNADILNKINYLYSYFLNFARRELYSEADPEDVVQEFWEIKMIQQNALANYEARGGASLKTFCINVLGYHIKDVNRKILREREIWFEKPEQDRELTSSKEIDSPYQYSPFVSPDLERVVPEDFILDEASRRMASLYPQDAKIIRLRMEDKSYAEIAELLTDDRTPMALKRAENQIKKRCTREDAPSSQFRFSVIIERLLVEKELMASRDSELGGYVELEVSEEQEKLFAQMRREAMAAFSSAYPEAASMVRLYAAKMTFARFALTFGRKNGYELFKKKTPEEKKFDQFIQVFLNENNLLLTINEGVPALVQF